MSTNHFFSLLVKMCYDNKLKKKKNKYFRIVLPKVVVCGPVPGREPAAAGPQSESRNWTENRPKCCN